MGRIFCTIFTKNAELCLHLHIGNGKIYVVQFVYILGTDKL